MSTATFVKSDAITKGTWYNGTTPVYGGDGYGVFGQNKTGDAATFTPGSAADYLQYPAYATVTIGTGTSGYVFLNPDAVAQALLYAPPQSPAGSRVEAAYYASPNFTLDVNDGSNHQVAIYCCDFDSGGRAQTITLTDDDPASPTYTQTLDTRSLSSFSGGVWLVWDVAGIVKFTFTVTSGGNALVSGIFFDPAPAAPAVFPPFVSRPRFEPALYE